MLRLILKASLFAWKVRNQNADIVVRFTNSQGQKASRVFWNI